MFVESLKYYFVCLVVSLGASKLSFATIYILSSGVLVLHSYMIPLLVGCLATREASKFSYVCLYAGCRDVRHHFLKIFITFFLFFRICVCGMYHCTTTSLWIIYNHFFNDFVHAVAASLDI